MTGMPMTRLDGWNQAFEVLGAANHNALTACIKALLESVDAPCLEAAVKLERDQYRLGFIKAVSFLFQRSSRMVRLSAGLNR